MDARPRPPQSPAAAAVRLASAVIVSERAELAMKATARAPRATAWLTATTTIPGRRLACIPPKKSPAPHEREDARPSARASIDGRGAAQADGVALAMKIQLPEHARGTNASGVSNLRRLPASSVI